MELSIRRIVVFTNQMEAMASFYRDIMGLRQIADEKGWKEFDAGGCIVGLHNGTPAVGRRPPKMVFYAAEVAAVRTVLLKRGASFGKVKSGNGLDLCEGHDPDGNPIQLSNRK